VCGLPPWYWHFCVRDVLIAGLPHCSLVRVDLAVQRRHVILPPPVMRYLALPSAEYSSLTCLTDSLALITPLNWLPSLMSILAKFFLLRVAVSTKRACGPLSSIKYSVACLDVVLVKNKGLYKPFDDTNYTLFRSLAFLKGQPARS